MKIINGYFLPQEEDQYESYFKHYENYQEEQRNALVNKSQKSGVEFPTLLEVYMRGLAASPIYGKTPAQYAFDRVNSFIAGGHSQKNLDADIWENCQLQESRSNEMKKFVTLDAFHKGPSTKKPAPEWGTKDMADRYNKVTPGQPDDTADIGPLIKLTYNVKNSRV